MSVSEVSRSERRSPNIRARFSAADPAFCTRRRGVLLGDLLPAAAIAPIVGRGHRYRTRIEHHRPAVQPSNLWPRGATGSSWVALCRASVGDGPGYFGLVGELKEQWWRVIRFRDRYAHVLQAAPRELMSTARIPEERMKEIRQWMTDCQDFGVTCCLHLHHLKDWAHHDPSVPLTKTDVDVVIDADPALQAIADICIGVKHNDVRKPRSDLTDPAGVVRSTSLNWRRDASSEMMLSATHKVSLDPDADPKAAEPLLELIDKGIASWTTLLRTHNVIKAKP